MDVFLLSELNIMKSKKEKKHFKMNVKIATATTSTINNRLDASSFKLQTSTPKNNNNKCNVMIIIISIFDSNQETNKCIIIVLLLWVRLFCECLCFVCLCVCVCLFLSINIWPSVYLCILFLFWGYRNQSSSHFFFLIRA